MENIPTYSEYIYREKYDKIFLEISNEFIERISEELKYENQNFNIELEKYICLDDMKYYLNQKLNPKGWSIDIEFNNEWQEFFTYKVELKEYLGLEE